MRIRYDFYDTQFYSDRRLVFKNGKYGFLDKDGREVIPLKFDFAQQFIASVAIVAINKKYGAIDTQGHIVVELKYDSIRYISGASLCVELNGKYDILNLRGKKLNDSSFDEVLLRDSPIVRTNNKYGLISKYGQIIIPTEYDNIEYISKNYYKVTLNNLYGIIDTNNTLILPVKYESIWQTGPYFIVKDKGLFGVTDIHGNTLIGPSYSNIELISLDHFKAANLDQKVGVIDINNNIIVPFEFSYIISTLPKTFNTYIAGKTSSYTTVISNGKIINTPYEFIFPDFYNEHGVIKFAQYVDGILKEGLLDYTGKVITQPKYNSIEYFYSGNLEMAKVMANNFYGCIDTLGKEIIPPEFDSIRFSDTGYIVVQKGSLYGIYDKNGNKITETIYEDIDFVIGSDYAEVKLNGYYGLLYFI